MLQPTDAGRRAAVRFTGTRAELFGILFRGYLLMLPTLGVYRFWLTTWKRRFYWSHTEIDGDPLEYTGNALQLLVGFLFAVAFFLPLYGIFFLISTQSPTYVIWGYGGVGVLLWFFTGYAIYRARDFRLSRTLWRGIRLDQKGSAWGYAARRFGWSVLMVLTLGLVYPFMAGNLWRYRYRNTWYGDRRFDFTGSWKTVAGVYYAIYGLTAAMLGGLAAYAAGNLQRVPSVAIPLPSAAAILLAVPIAVFVWLAVYFYRAREISRMFSSVCCGAARISVRLRGRALLGQFLLYSLALSIAYTGIGIVVIAALAMTAAAGGVVEFWQYLLTLPQGGLLTVAGLALGYLGSVAVFSLMSEVFLGYGYWMLVARGAQIEDADSLRSVRAGAEDPSLIGEGLADALNVGAY